MKNLTNYELNYFKELVSNLITYERLSNNINNALKIQSNNLNNFSNIKVTFSFDKENVFNLDYEPSLAYQIFSPIIKDEIKSIKEKIDTLLNNKHETREIETIINVSKDFSKFPAGRYKTDGEFSGELFRDSLLLPAFRNSQKITVFLDGVIGYSSSFLMEAFGGLVKCGISKEEIRKKLNLVSEYSLTIFEINQYINEA